MSEDDQVPKIIEEHFDDLAMGVEAEQDENGNGVEEIDEPWRPELIRVNTKTFSLRNIIDNVEEGSLELAPDFQRMRVWTQVQKSRLIESILLQIPLPVFYFAEDGDGLQRVVDGLQRLSAIKEFVRGGTDGKGGYALRGLEYLEDANKKYYFELPAKWQRRLLSSQIIAHVIDPDTPARVKYDIFRRINTGGTPLNSQEIRHCMSKQRSRDFLQACAATAAFREATDNALIDHRRMVDREAVLRFAAFWRMDNISQYKSKTYGGGSMDGLLSRTTEALDSQTEVSQSELDSIQAALEQGCRNAQRVFGREHAFRKWSSEDQERRNPFNRALFESWSVELAKVSPDELTDDRVKQLAARARKAMSDDFEYISAVTLSTGFFRKVESRFRKTAEMIREALR